MNTPQPDHPPARAGRGVDVRCPARRGARGAGRERARSRRRGRRGTGLPPSAAGSRCWAATTPGRRGAASSCARGCPGRRPHDPRGHRRRRPLRPSGLRAILSTAPDLDVVGDADDGAGVPDLVGAARPDVVVMDIRMPRSTASRRRPSPRRAARRGCSAHHLPARRPRLRRDRGRGERVPAQGHAPGGADRRRAGRRLGRRDAEPGPHSAPRAVADRADRRPPPPRAREGSLQRGDRGGALLLRGDCEDPSDKGVHEARRHEPGAPRALAATPTAEGPSVDEPTGPGRRSAGWGARIGGS